LPEFCADRIPARIVADPCPGGGSADNPVGTVWFAWAIGQQVQSERRQFEGDRAAVRAATVEHALRGVLALVAPTSSH
jgi:nicotinamide-nucleotide amidase